jgi:hypothetical protein
VDDDGSAADDHEARAADGMNAAATILRSARIARRLTSRYVAEVTKLPPRVVAAVENGRFDQIQSAFYARAYVRMYAQAVGLSDPRLIRTIVEAIPMGDVELETIVKCRETCADRHRRHRTAVAVDGAVVAVLSAGGVLFCMALTDTAAWDLRDISMAFLVLAVPTLMLYFGLLGATGVGTAGARLFGVDFVAGLEGPVDGVALLRRSCEYVRSEAVALLGSPASGVLVSPHHSGAEEQRSESTSWGR